MKIWSSYGSEHSANLVMIGQFKSPKEAKDIGELFQKLTDGLQDKIDVGTLSGRYSDEVYALLQRLNCYSLSPLELEQFLYENEIKIDGSKIVITTEESDVSAFFKLMILQGAKVEIYSAHDYPGTGYGRGGYKDN